ncbi:recombinase family protein [Chitinophaga alhagiae]|uniref:recombinase family protein n=1 Tax=Chitinophaga alhagiae TaxID=2203219 RepID=UPI000E5BE624|nr:recombinase family protein [Chitinophaga alhagiae]
MFSAILYIRVSTDEQAQKGYSQRSQEEKLNKYCKDNHIEIAQTIFEDHSAKNFNRPGWSVMLKQLNSSKASRPNLILFTRWDRFSRNTANAYYMITRLEKMGIEPQATDQPLDMAIPENKVLLAMYIVTAEVENDRRSLNIKQGIYKAKKEGRYMGKAPIGYVNISMPDGRKAIVPREPEATLIRKTFETFEETTSVRSLYKTALQKGLKCSLNAFFNMLQNPVYCGRIRLPSIEGKTNYKVPGVHIPIISEELFFQVQSRIKHRDNKYIKQNANSELMFKDSLHCPICLKKLSGSGSTGRSKRYFYYHCYYPCSYRVRADYVNEHLLSVIGCLKPEKVYIPIFEKLIEIVYHRLCQQKSIDKVNINRSLHKLVERAANARELLVKGIIDEEDYLSIKSDCENRIDILGEQLNDAYRLEAQQKQSLKTLTAYFLNPALLFQKVCQIVQLKVAALYLQENLVYSGTDIFHYIKPEVQMICGFSLTSMRNCKRPEDTANVTKEQQDLVAKIMEVGRDKGHEIDAPDGLRILSFLSALAEICVSIKMLSEGN